MATHFSGVGNTPVENPKTQDIDNISEDESQDEDLIRQLLCKTANLKQFVEDRDNEPREAIHDLEQRLNDLTLTLCHQNTPIENVLDRYTKTLCTAQKKTSLESSLLQDIPILNGQDSSQLEDWLTDIETASELTNESRTKLAQAKSRGLVRTLTSKALTAQKSWEEIKDSLCLKISNADIYTSISRFMDIQQTDKESLATYVHKFKQEASRCKFNNDATTIRIFLKGLKNAHTIVTKVYKKGPQTLSEAIKEVEKLQAAQQITSTLLPTLSVNTMSSDNDRCFHCQEIGHMACYCPHICCYDCDNYGHVAMDCPDKIPPSGTPACCRTDTNDRSRRPSSRHHSHTRQSCHDGRDRSRFSHSRSCTPVTTAIEVVATRTLTEVTPDLSTDLPIAASHMTGALVPTATAVTHLTADLHLIGILPKMTADLDTDPESNTTDQPEDLHPLHRHHLGNIRTRDTNRSQLMTHHQSTTAQMTMKVTQMMI